VQRYEHREIVAKEETNKHKNGSLSPVRSTYFPPNLRQYCFQIFKLFLKNAVKPAGDQGEQNRRSLLLPFFSLSFYFFARYHPKTTETTQVCLWVKEKEGKKPKNCWELLDLSFDQLSQLNGNKLCSGLSLQRLRRQRVEAQRTLPNGYESGFSRRITCFRKIKLDLYFSREKASLCDADESRQETYWNQWRLRLCAELQREQTRRQRGLDQFTLQCVSLSLFLLEKTMLQTLSFTSLFVFYFK